MKYLRFQVQHRPWDQISALVIDQFSDDARSPVKQQIWQTVHDSVWNSVGSHIQAIIQPRDLALWL